MRPTPQGWPKAALEARIAAHVRAWEAARHAARAASGPLPFVTISRRFGCEGVQLAAALVERLNQKDSGQQQPWVAYDRDVLDRVCAELHLRREIVEAVDEHRRSEFSELFDAVLNRKVDETVIFRKVAEVIRALALHGHAIIVGRGGYLLTRDLEAGLHVQLVAPRDWRIRNVAAWYHLSVSEAEKLLEQREREREHFLQTFFVMPPPEAVLHHLVLDNSRFSVARMAEIVCAAI